MSVIALIAEWKNAAENEKYDREYFYKPQWLDRILDGERCIVIGRKGTGKTAITEFVTEHAGQEREMSASLSLSALDIPAIGPASEVFSDSQTLTKAWTYIILRAVAELHLESPESAKPAVQQFEQIMGVSVGNRKGASILERLRRVRLDIGIFGVELGVSGGRKNAENTLELKIQQLKDFIETFIYTRPYRVIFDALDKGWIEACQDKKQAKYLRVVGSLIQASIDVSNHFRSLSLPRKIYPLVFIRSDIFSQIANAQRTAWQDDHATVLPWSNADLREMVKHRILQTARQLDAKSDEKKALQATFRAQTGDVIDFSGRSKRMSLIDYAIDYSLGRPRDLVIYLALAAKRALEKRSKISKEILEETRKDYGHFLRREIDDELHGEYPGIRRFLNGLQSEGHQTISFETFTRIAKDRLADDLGCGDVLLLAERLYEISFLGHVLPDGTQSFAVKNRDQDFDEELPLCIHPCYAAALRLQSSDAPALGNGTALD